LAFIGENAGVLCGARSHSLLDQLKKAQDLEVLFSEIEGMPQHILVRGNSQESIAARARTLGFHIQNGSSIALLSVIPNVRNIANWRTASLPETPGWSVQRFSNSRLRWVPSSQEEARRTDTGFYRFDMKFQRFYYLRRHGCSYEVPVELGKYAVIGRHDGLLAYDKSRRSLSVPRMCQPPLLVERALILCSGFLPKFDPSSRRLEYSEIPLEVARLTAQLLSQEVR
jgi:hypothetical protein